MFTAHDLLYKPLSIVQSQLRTKLDKGEDLSTDWGLAELLDRLSINEQEVPSLNAVDSASIPRDTLVRFRGMIQDIFNPEFYFALFEQHDTKTGQKTLSSGRYVDAVTVPEHVKIITDSDQTKTLERLPLYCVPVPCEAKWVQDILNAQVKRRTEQPNTTQDELAPSRGRKRGRAETPNDIDMDSEDNVTSQPHAFSDVDSNSQDKLLKKRPVRDTCDATDKHGVVPDLNTPVSLDYSYGKTPVIVKVYDVPPESFKINEVWEFIGILASPVVDLPEEGEDDEAAMLNNQPRIAGDFIPRLHCIKCRKVTTMHPSIPTDTLNLAITLEDIRRRASEIRSSFIDLLTSLLGGDKLAAEYLLCNLLSKVYARIGDVESIGNFPLNLSRCPSYSIELTRDFLEAKNLFPYKDYDEDRLVTGIFQLPDGTHIVIDETKLDAGSLQSKGYTQLLGLGEMIQSQKVTYDFKFHQTDLAVDLPILVLSQGRSIFKSTIHLPLLCTTDPMPFEVESISEDLLSSFRLYLSLLRNHLPFQESSEEVSKFLQDQFVQLRKDNAGFTVEQFRLCLTLSRLVALSFGENELTQERWNRVLSMEFARTQRLETLQAKSPNKCK